ncbi:hypothetical protein ACQPZQ_02460 [Pseudonocardia sp. CA-142604]|uniref:hypothetical protein n=1 Tax=Pseudonocardia sp. CA-142604 TaxID=3240024 RepID=UPI003D8E0335
MATISWTRRSYEATVLLIPLDAEARTWIDIQGATALEGITVADAGLLARQGAFRPQPVPATGEGTATSSPIDLAIDDADAVVVLCRDLPAVDVQTVMAIGDAARVAGTLLGAVIITPDARWSGHAAQRGATAIREAADNVILLKDSALALAFLHVLRGGTHDGELAGATR